MELKCDKNVCCGCESCVNACSQNAISMIQENGFEYPKINQNLCIECNRCNRLCPSINPVQKNKESDNYFAVINNDKLIRDTSSSGGIFYELAYEVICRGGTVFGVELANDLSVLHTRVDSIEHLYRLQGSKYTQSKVGNCLRLVREDLNKGKWVLFSGTPCQIGGLLKYLNKDYDKLITCEVLCHGNASQEVFHMNIEHIETKYSKKIIYINYRSKSEERPQNLEYTFLDDTSLIYTNPLDDPYYKGFQNGTLLRNSCFSCNYIGVKRVADITLGDFWGLKENAIVKPDSLTYPSLLILSTEKGVNLWNSVKNKFTYTIRGKEEAVAGNLSLRRVIPKNCYHDKFFNNIDKLEYSILINKYIINKKTWKDYIKQILGNKISTIIIKGLKR